MPNSDVHLFWDNSNIFISAKRAAETEERSVMGGDVRIQFDALVQLATAGRALANAVCVGSVPPELERVWEHLRRTGVEVELYERGAQSATEQAVDQALQVHMLRALADEPDPGVAVLLTGDGAGFHFGRGFHADLQRMHDRGWAIEVISWEVSCNQRMQDWVDEVGVFVALEDYYDAVTFLEGTRPSLPLSLKARPRAR